MSWRSSGDVYRQPISIDNTAGGAGAFDATVAIPTDWDHFWTTVDTAGDQIRVTQPDGSTLVTKFDLASFDVATKSGTLEIQDTAPAAGMLQYWLYWGDDSLSSGITAFAPAGALTAHLDLGVPVPAYLFAAQGQQRLGDSSPINKMAKTSDTTVFAWLDFSGLMQRRHHSHPLSATAGGSHEYECLSYVTVGAGAGALTATASATRYEVGTAGAALVRIQLSAGASGTSYIVTVTAITTLGRTLTGKIDVVVLDMAT
jgi:hypothetical protein